MTPQIPIDETILLGYSGGFPFLVSDWGTYLSFFPIPIWVMNKTAKSVKMFSHKWPAIIYN